jgi:hypothetical protein
MKKNIGKCHLCQNMGELYLFDLSNVPTPVLLCRSCLPEVKKRQAAEMPYLGYYEVTGDSFPGDLTKVIQILSKEIDAQTEKLNGLIETQNLMKGQMDRSESTRLGVQRRKVEDRLAVLKRLLASAERKQIKRN